MAAAGALLREFTERSLLPKVEERMARLNLAVSTARKGLKNRLTRLWKGAAAEPGPSMVRFGCACACNSQQLSAAIVFCIVMLVCATFAPCHADGQSRIYAQVRGAPQLPSAAASQGM
jgi:hypothetical protein